MNLNLHTLPKIQTANKEATDLLSLEKTLNAKEGQKPSDFEKLLEMVNSGKLPEGDVNEVFNALQDGNTKDLEVLLKKLEVTMKEDASGLTAKADTPKLALPKTELTLNENSNLKNILETSKAPKAGENTLAVKEADLSLKLNNSKETQLLKEAPLKEVLVKNNAESQVVAKTLKTPVDAKSSELVDFNQFMAKQSPNVQKRMAMNSYGNHQEKKLFEQKFDTKVDTSVLARPVDSELVLEKSSDTSQEMTKDFMQNSDSRHPQTLKTQTTNAVFDMNKLTTSDTQKVIDQVQNYIMQSRVGNEAKVEMSFQHNDLGKIDLMVEKMGKDALNIRIQTHGNEGASFFTKHQGDLLQTLNNSGIQVAGFKLESSATSTNSNSNNQQFSQGETEQGRAEQEFAGQNQRRQDSERRSELWKLLNEREAA